LPTKIKIREKEGIVKTLKKLYGALMKLMKKRQMSRKLIYKPDMLFREESRTVAVRIIKNYLSFPPKVVLLKANWSFLSIDEGEINETSNHSLNEKLKRMGVLTFSACRNSMVIEPLNNPRETIKEVVEMLFEKAEREDRATELIKGHFLSVK